MVERFREFIAHRYLILREYNLSRLRKREKLDMLFGKFFMNRIYDYDDDEDERVRMLLYYIQPEDIYYIIKNEVVTVIDEYLGWLSFNLKDKLFDSIYLDNFEKHNELFFGGGLFYDNFIRYVLGLIKLNFIISCVEWFFYLCSKVLSFWRASFLKYLVYNVYIQNILFYKIYFKCRLYVWVYIWYILFDIFMIYLNEYQFFVFDKISYIKYSILKYVYKLIYRLLYLVELGLVRIFLS